MTDQGREGVDVQTNHQVRLNLWNFNLPQIVTTIIAVGGVGWAIATSLNGMENRLVAVEGKIAQSEISYASRRAATDERFKKIEDNMEPIGSLVIRVKALEDIAAEGIKTQQKTVDALNDMRVAVGVLSNKIDNLAEDGRRRAELHLGQPPIMDR